MNERLKTHSKTQKKSADLVSNKLRIGVFQRYQMKCKSVSKKSPRYTKAEIPHIKAKYTLDGKELTAPISAHQRVGEIELYDRDKQVAHWPLVTLESVGEGSMFSRLSDYFHHKA